MVEVSKSELAGALSALGKLICRTSPEEAYRSILIQSKKAGVLSFLTANAEESMEVSLHCVGENDEFAIAVPFEAFRLAVRNCKTKSLVIDHQGNSIRIAGVSLESVKASPRVVTEVPEKVASQPLREGFVSYLMVAASVVDRHDVRRVLQGVNLSADGITVTNGKELLNIPMPLIGVSVTLPFPLALLATKCMEAGAISTWEEKEVKFFQIRIGNWCWTGKALQGTYPNWKRIIPSSSSLTHSVKFDVDCADALETFLQDIASASPHTCITLSQEDGRLVAKGSNDATKSVTAEFTGNWDGFSVAISRDILLRLLSEGHRELKFASDRAPFVATQGIGTYIVMPLYIPAVTVPKIEPQKEARQVNVNNVNVTTCNKTAFPQNAVTPTDKKPQKEESQMNANNVKVVVAPVPQVVNPIAAEVNALDDLGNAIEEFKQKIKAMFDESNALSRKVKEVSIQQKQKERDFIQAKRAIERIRMAI